MLKTSCLSFLKLLGNHQNDIPIQRTMSLFWFIYVIMKDKTF